MVNDVSTSTNGIQKGSQDDLVTSFDAEGILIREADWGGQNVSFQRFPKGFDIRPLLKGLPRDECQCPHYGYVLSGTMVAVSGGREVRVRAGETYYLAPGHSVRFDEVAEVLEWSPSDALAKTMAVIERNLKAQAPAGGAR